jgi:hypothetical protein
MANIFFQEETTVIQEDIPGAAAIQVTNQNSQAELEQIAQRLNLQGELDPQTGIFYNTQSSSDNPSVDNMTQSQIVVSSGGKSFDLLSSSLEQAQINLDSYQFLEEDILTEKATIETVTVDHPGTEVVGKVYSRNDDPMNKPCVFTMPLVW